MPATAIAIQRTNRKMLLVSWLPLAALFGLMLAVNMSVALYRDNDDAFFLQATRSVGLNDFITDRYTHWSGRVFSELLRYLIFNQPLIYWKILNSGMIALLGFSLAALLFGWGFWRRISRGQALAFGLICAGFGWVAHPVLVAAVFWVTGSLDYLWPPALGAFALIPFAQRTIHRSEQAAPLPAWLFPLFALAGVGACLGGEQGAALLIGLGAASVLYRLYRERRLDVGLSALLVCFVLAALVSITAPGNAIRYRAEMNSFPEFATLSINRRVYMTASWMLEKVFIESRMLSALLMVLLSVVSFGLPGRALRRLQRLYVGLTLLLATAAVNWPGFNKLGGEVLETFLFNFQTPETMLKELAQFGVFSPRFWIGQAPLLIWGAALVITVILLSAVRQPARPYGGRALALIFLAGLGALFLVSLSPTIYGSGPRTAFAFNLAQIFVIAALFQPLGEDLSRPTTAWLIAWLYFLPMVNLILIGRYLLNLH